MSNYTVLNNRVREYKNFVTEAEAAELIAYLEENKKDADYISFKSFEPLPEIFQSVRNRAMAEMQELAGDVELEHRTFKIWKHGPGASTKPKDYHHFAFLIYLNNEYDGGNFIMPSQNIAIRPEALSMLLFETGDAFGVDKVNDGDRYSIGGASKLAFIEDEQPGPNG